MLIKNESSKDKILMLEKYENEKSTLIFRYEDEIMKLKNELLNLQTLSTFFKFDR